MKVLAVVSLARTLAFVSAAPNMVKTQAMNDSIFEKVVGGYHLDIGHILTQVAILELTALLCSGNIIKDNIILSVAHALHGRNKSQLKVRSGSNFYNTWGRLVAVATTIIHPKYKHCQKCHKFDIALVILARPAVAHGILASAIELWDARAFFPPGTIGRVSGWGATEPNGAPSGDLITIAVTIISSDDCTVQYGPDTASNNICGGNGRTHLCPGDSGAGLVIEFKLAGLAAFGRHCGLINTPSGYTSIAAHRAWIREEAGV